IIKTNGAKVSENGPSPSENLEEYEKRIAEAFTLLERPPFTLQRLCELTVRPNEHHRTLWKYLRALEKVLVVTSAYTGSEYEENKSGDQKKEPHASPAQQQQPTPQTPQRRTGGVSDDTITMNISPERPGLVRNQQIQQQQQQQQQQEAKPPTLDVDSETKVDVGSEGSANEGQQGKKAEVPIVAVGGKGTDNEVDAMDMD
ncbi:hypothetical protein HK102_010332, partial [Quaeritorhiza haematococci]